MPIPSTSSTNPSTPPETVRAVLRFLAEEGTQSATRDSAIVECLYRTLRWSKLARLEVQPASSGLILRLPWQAGRVGVTLFAFPQDSAVASR